MRDQHTPGPWIAEKISSFVRDSDTEGEIANVVARGPYGLITLAEEVSLADARLIAAAPELLEALDGCIQHMEWSTPQGRAAYETAKATIAKAKGKS